jgi:hypothetical protein
MAGGGDPDFTFFERTNTVCINVDGVYKEGGVRFGKSDVADLLRKDLNIDSSDIVFVQLHSIQKVVCVKLSSELKVEEVKRKLAEGVRWSRCDQEVTGWKCGSEVTHVKILNVAPELSLEVVEEVMKEYGEVLDSRWNEWGADLPNVSDGTISVRLERSEGVRLPNFVKRVRSDGEDAAVWQLIYRGQGIAGCWKCGVPGHIGRYCPAGRRSYSTAASRLDPGLTVREGEELRRREVEERREEGKRKAAATFGDARRRKEEDLDKRRTEDEEVKRKKEDEVKKRAEEKEVKRKEEEEEEVKRRVEEEEVKRRAEEEEEVKRRSAVDDAGDEVMEDGGDAEVESLINLIPAVISLKSELGQGSPVAHSLEDAEDEKFEEDGSDWSAKFEAIDSTAEGAGGGVVDESQGLDVGIGLVPLSGASGLTPAVVGSLVSTLDDDSSFSSVESGEQPKRKKKQKKKVSKGKAPVPAVLTGKEATQKQLRLARENVKDGGSN